MTKLPDGTIAAFLTLGGATVAVTKLNTPTNPRFDHGWRCLGCGENDAPDTLPGARQAANGHAGQCRSIPLPA